MILELLRVALIAFSTLSSDPGCKDWNTVEIFGDVTQAHVGFTETMFSAAWHH